VRVSSSPTTRGTRVERGGAQSSSAARRAIPEPSDTSSQARPSADRRSAEAVDRSRRWSLQEPERQLLTNLAMAVTVILFITVVVPVLISLVRNF
jgi:hypothetical protein